MHRIAAILASFVAMTSAAGFAQEATEPFDPRLAPVVAFEAGAGQIDEDTVVAARAVLGFSLGVPTLGCSEEEERCETLLRFALQAPIRLVVVDQPPEQDGVIREQDWDQTGDFLRIIRTLRFGEPGEAFYLRGGELTQRRLGHATIVDGYTNVIGPNRFEFGVQSNVNTRYGGAELLLDDVVEPQVAGGRIYIRPWSFTQDNEFMERVAMGLTVMTDIRAPTSLEADNGAFVLADDGQLVVSGQETTVATGFDVEFVSLQGDNYALTHYFDGNLLGDAPGIHLGTLLDLPFDPRVQLALRGEFRALGRGYIPGYFSPLHEIDRYAYRGWGVDTVEPKRRVAASMDDSALGGLVGFDLRVAPWVKFGMSYAGHEGEANDTLGIRMDVGPVGPVRVGAYYFRQNVDAFDDTWDVQSALFVSEARVAVWGPIYTYGSFMRTFQPDQDEGYRLFNAWEAGTGAAFTF